MPIKAPREMTDMVPPNDLLRKLAVDVKTDSQAIQDFFVKMLRIKAVNPRMGGTGEVERAQFLESFLKDEGLSVTRVDVMDDELHLTRPNLSAKLDGRDSSRNLWFLAHMDTVPEGSLELWKKDPFEPTIKEGKIIARGAEDNGQSLVGSLFALRELRKLGATLPFNVGVWLVSDEEFGSTYGVKRLLAGNHFKKSDLVVVPDAGTPKGADIEIAEKGLLWMKVTTKGKQVHASLPRKGLNAHRVGMKLALDLDESLSRKYNARDRLFDEPLSTFEPTKKDANVANINTVPGIDVFYFDCRVLPRYGLDDVISDVKTKIGQYQKRYGVTVSMQEVEKDTAGPATSEKSEVVTLLAEAIKRVSRIQPRTVGIGGQTVGNLLRKEGIPTAVWSTVDDVPHEPNEYSRIKNLLNDTKVFAAIPLLA
jgi:succinyl-diaminopimelate desuccinylase